MASDIQVSFFSAVPAVGGITLGAMASAPVGFEDLSYMQPAKLRFFRNSSSTPGTATQIGESTSGVFVYETTATYWYFAAAVDPAGNEGPRTAGKQVVPKTTQPPPNSVGTPELKDGAATPAKMSVVQLSAITANLGTVNAGIINGLTINGGLINGSAIASVKDDAKVTIADGILYAGPISGTGSECILRGGFNTAATFVAVDNIQVVAAQARNTGNNAHALRAFNSGTGGGHAVLGVSAGGGGWALNAQTGGVYSAGGYHPFTGMHECLVRKDAALAVGDIACAKRVIARDGLDNVLTEIERTAGIGDRRVIGVVSKRREMPLFSQIAALGPEPRDRGSATPVRLYLAKHYDLVTVNALGEGQMEVCGRGGDIGAGDFIIASDLPGKGQRLDMDQPVTFGLQAAILAQTMEPVTFDSPDQVRRVAVFYRCG